MLGILLLLSQQCIEPEKNKENPTDIEDLNIINHLDLTDIYRIIYLIMVEYTFLSGLHGTLTRRDHILGYKTSQKRKSCRVCSRPQIGLN